MAGVQSIERAFALLRALSLGPCGVTELAERTGLPKSTVSRLLSALEDEKAVEQLEVAGEYQLGTGLIDLAGGAQPGRNLVASARPHLLELVNQIGEIAGISTFDLSKGTVYYLDHAKNDEDDVTVSSLTILTLEPSDFAVYVCQAENGFGSDEIEIRLELSGLYISL